jgi:uncharacterized protein (TIGR02284 family)
MVFNDRIEVLNELVAQTYDARDGFHLAAQQVIDIAIRTLLRGYAEQRARAAGSLATEVRGLGGHPPEYGSLAGALRRAWLDAKTSLIGQDDAQIIEDCRRGESSLLHEYQEAMDAELLGHVKDVLGRHVRTLQTSLDRLHVLANVHRGEACMSIG